MSNTPDQPNPGEDRVDEIGRIAGAALRRPAPADGMARVHSSRRRRRTARAVASGSAVVVIGIGLFVLGSRGTDDVSSINDSGPAVSSTGSVLGTSSTSSTTSTSSSTTTTQPSTTAPSSAPGWERVTEQFPQLTFDSCCGTDWEGDPSPAVPTDPAQPLPAGIYNVQAVSGQGAGDTGDSLALEVRPYVRCNELADHHCFGAEPYPDTALGVPIEAARTIDVQLDDSVRVAVSGFECVDDHLLDNRYTASGTDLATLFAELDAAYETAVGAPLRQGVGRADIAADLSANRTGGFFDPGCPSYPKYAWAPPSGPGVLALLGLDNPAELPVPVPSPSASAAWIRPTGLIVDAQGGYTLYFYAGFLS